MNTKVVIEMCIDDYKVIDALIKASIKPHIHLGDGQTYEQAERGFKAWRKA